MTFCSSWKTSRTADYYNRSGKIWMAFPTRCCARLNARESLRAEAAIEKETLTLL
jgi:hypothetical protein